MADPHPRGGAPLSAADPVADQAPTRVPRSWSVAVRRARPEDREAVLALTRATWDGWDYIHEVWDDWVTDPVGAFLVATAEPGPDGTPPTDRDGTSLMPGWPIAIAHLAMPTPTEGWVEGIRVDPVVRGMDVATELVAGTLRAAEATGATVVRYVTSMANEGSVRLAARHGLLPIGEWRFHGRGREDDRAGSAGRAAVEEVLTEASAEGLMLPPTAATDADAWFARIAVDPTFRAGHGLYEHLGWKYQALTPALLADHLRAGEVLALGPDAAGHWALLLVNRARSLEEGELWPALLVGDGGLAAQLLDRLGGEAGPLARLRLPDPAPMLDGHGAAFRALGYVPHEGRMVVVEKRLR